MGSESFNNNKTNYDFKLPDFISEMLSQTTYNSGNSEYYNIGKRSYVNMLPETETVDFDTPSDKSETEAKADAAIGNAKDNKNFSDFNDYNRIGFECTPIMDEVREDYKNNKNSDKYKGSFVDEYGITHVKVNNMKIKDFISSETGEKIFTKRKLDAAGGGDFEVVEVLIDEDGGFDAIILKDSEGNYQISYGYTHTNGVQSEDVTSDLIIGLAGNKGTLGSLVNFGWHDSLQEKNMAIEAAKYAYELAKKDGKKLNMSGYSLGGALCEYGYLAVCDEPDSSKVLDSLTLHNPLHAAVSDSEISKIKNAKDFNLYVCETDFVHTINNYEEYKDVQKVYFSYEQGVKEDIEKIKENEEGPESSLYTLTVNYSHRLETMYKDDRIIERFENGMLRTENDAGESPKNYDRNDLMEMYCGSQFHDFYSLIRHETVSWNNYIDDLLKENTNGFLGFDETLKDAGLVVTDFFVTPLTAIYSLYTVDLSSPSSICSALSKTASALFSEPFYKITDFVALGLDFFGLEDAGNVVQEVGSTIGKAIYEVEDFVSEKVGEFADAVATTASGFAEGFCNFMENTGSAIADGWSSMCSAVGGLFGW